MQYNSIHTGEDIDAGISKTQGVASNATANATDAQLRDRGTHTGTQPLSSISGAAALASPTFTGTPAAPTAAAETNTTQIATTAYTRTAIPNVLNASGVAPMYACRAWINFNGTGGTVILANGNVSSIADHAVGDYTINFTIKMLEANYCITGSTQRGTSGGAGDFGVRNNSITRESVGVVTADGTGVLEDASTVSVAIFR